jgi:acyl-CoA synthetase (AMP-forming)/AMP-acid ligase II
MSSVHALSLADIAVRNARFRPDAEAVVCGSHRATYRQLEKRVRRLAGALSARGVGPGDRVAWLGRNCHVALEALLACGRLGAMLCPLNWRGQPEEVAFWLRDLQPGLVIYDDQIFAADTIAACQDALAEPASWLERSRYESVLDSPAADKSAADGPPSDGFRETDPVLVLYTGAFDGHASGSMLTHQNLLTQGLLWVWLWGFDERTVYLACGPMFHVAAWMSIVPALLAGGKVVITERADAETVCQLIDGERCTNGLVLPQTIEKILELNAGNRYDLSCFRSFVRIPGWIGMVQADGSLMGRSPGGYGQTEVTGSATVSALGPRPDDLTSGVASPAALVRVVTADDIEAGPGEIGEIVVRGPIVHAGYWNRPEVNAVRNRGGWWHTGDLGRTDPDGAISFIGPRQRMLKSGVENIYPVEVELCLEAHAKVKEAAVIGVPDERWIQSVRALVVRQPDAELTEAEVIAWCASRLASYKKPRSVIFVDSVPRAGHAKDYDTLDRDHGGGNYPGSGTSYITAASPNKTAEG